VQGVLEEALAILLRTPVTLVVAGRTDAGVHATGQVAHVDVPDPALDVEELGARLARLLAPDVRVPSVRPAPPGFDARFSALCRRYHYRVSDDPRGADPLRRHDTLTWHRGLDCIAMNAASIALLGERDFAAFCRSREGATTIRTLQRFEWIRPEPHLLVAHVAADAFCHSMVRSLVGALLAVGDRRRPTIWPESLLAGTQRSSEVQVAPAHGLTLVEVTYPPDAGLAARAETTRAVRSRKPPA
jgi:tRNA pseudouridine38-40 synthase